MTETAKLIAGATETAGDLREATSMCSSQQGRLADVLDDGAYEIDRLSTALEETEHRARAWEASYNNKHVLMGCWKQRAEAAEARAERLEALLRKWAYQPPEPTPAEGLVSEPEDQEEHANWLRSAEKLREETDAALSQGGEEPQPTAPGARNHQGQAPDEASGARYEARGTAVYWNGEPLIETASEALAEHLAKRLQASKDLERYRKALEPFASFARQWTDENGWAGTTMQREPISNWFGPSDFRNALAALERGKDHG